MCPAQTSNFPCLCEQVMKSDRPPNLPMYARRFSKEEAIVMNKSPSVNLKPALGLASKGHHKSYHTLIALFWALQNALIAWSKLLRIPHREERFSFLFMEKPLRLREVGGLAWATGFGSTRVVIWTQVPWFLTHVQGCLPRTAPARRCLHGCQVRCRLD